MRPGADRISTGGPTWNLTSRVVSSSYTPLRWKGEKSRDSGGASGWFVAANPRARKSLGLDAGVSEEALLLAAGEAVLKTIASVL